MVDRTRRRALLAAGTVSIAAVAGCTSLLGPNCRPREAPQWKIDGERWSPPIQQDNRLLVSENYGATGNGMLSRIACIADYDGQEQWIYTVQDGGAGIPRVHDGTVYVGTGTDLVYALDLETGHRRWQYDAGGQEEYGGGAWGAPAVVDDRVIVGVSHSERPDPDPTNSDAYIHRVVALNTGDGAEQWTLPVEGMVWAGPVHIDDSVVVVTRTGRILRLDPRTGKRLWGPNSARKFAHSQSLVMAPCS